MTRTVWEETEDYICTLENKDGFTFVHLDVYNWSSQVLGSIRKRLEDLKEDIRSRGETILYSYFVDEKVGRFTRLVCPYDYEEVVKHPEHGDVHVIGWDLGEI